MSTVIGIFTNRSQAERAVGDLKQKGFAENKFSIVARQGYIHGDANDTNDSYRPRMEAKSREGENMHTTDETMESGVEAGGMTQSLATGTTTGGALGGLTGLLAGAGLFTIPGVGPLLALGPIAAGLAGAAAGGLTGSLVDLGIDPDRGQDYAQEVERGGILAAVECEQSQINDAAVVLRRNGARDVETF